MQPNFIAGAAAKIATTRTEKKAESNEGRRVRQSIGSDQGSFIVRPPESIKDGSKPPSGNNLGANSMDGSSDQSRVVGPPPLKAAPSEEIKIQSNDYDRQSSMLS